MHISLSWIERLSCWREYNDKINWKPQTFLKLITRIILLKFPKIYFYRTFEDPFLNDTKWTIVTVLEYLKVQELQIISSICRLKGYRDKLALCITTVCMWERVAIDCSFVKYVYFIFASYSTIRWNFGIAFMNMALLLIKKIKFV